MSRVTSWARVRQLFHDALAQPPEARDAFLAAASEDSGIRDEVRALLAAHEAAGGFMESPAVRLTGGSTAAAPTLRAGDQVGRFEVTGRLGAGGMGEVYRARDLQLARDVALKILPPALAADPQRLARFERESRLLASLDHPNIAAIHSIEHADGLHVLVLQLVEGPTLAERLKLGPVPLAEALSIASQLSRALEAAHDAGIVHRDLKPANVTVSSDGHVTLLDFGLAKERIVGRIGDDDTVEGAILGTWGYMSPEQARGLPADKRSDIWAFGCILYELLAARPAFASTIASESIAAVLEREPDWAQLPLEVPPRLHLLLHRLLEKDRANRLHDIADARLEIDDLRQGTGAAVSRAIDAPPPSPRRRWTRPAAAAVLAAVALVAGWWAGRQPGPSAVEPVTRFAWALPPGLALQSAPTVSPDGRRVAFAAAPAGAPAALYVRDFGDADARSIPGTEGAQQPFWSPDGRALGFFAGGELMRVALDPGAPVPIAPVAGDPKGGAWGRDGTIVFAPAQIENGLSQVRASGGSPRPATVLATGDGDNSHRWPAFLPDGSHFVYFVRSRTAARRGVYFGRIDRPAGPGTMLYRSESEAVFAPIDDREGLLLNAADGYLEVRRLDLNRMTVGDPTRLDVPAGSNTPHAASMLSAGANLLMHAASPLPYGIRLASVRLSGDDLRAESARGIINWPRLSPDGLRLASARVDPVTGTGDIWVEDLSRGTRTRVTHEDVAARLPVWSPDGLQIAYASGFTSPTLAVAAADGSGASRRIACPWASCEPTDWSSDGRWLVVQVTTGNQADVWSLSSDGSGETRPLLNAPFSERDARISQDGRLLAYVSEEAGPAEVSVRNVEGPPRRLVISQGGAAQPVWLRDGRSLAFVDSSGHLRVTAVRREADGRIVAGAPASPGVPAIGVGHWFTQYDVSPQGRLYFVDRQPAPGLAEMGFIMGWRGLVDRRAGRN